MGQGEDLILFHGLGGHVETYSRDFMSMAQHFHVVATVQIPLTGAPWAMLQVPYPMTNENWEEMENFLKLMRKPLTTK